MKEMMKDHTGCIKGFTQQSRTWYREAVSFYKDTSDEFMIGFYHPEGGTSGEFAVRWTELGGEQVPRLEAWEDAWHAMSQMPELIAMLAEVSCERITPAEFCDRLKGIGFEDLTEETRPSDN